MAVKTPAPERAAGRRALAAQGKALPDGSYVIPNVSYLHKAIRAVGRIGGPGDSPQEKARKRSALAKLIRKRGRELGAWDVVKGSWADNTQGAAAMTAALRTALTLSSRPLKLAADYHRMPGEDIQCPNCGKFDMPDAQYCDQCGQMLPPSAFPGGKGPEGYTRSPDETVQCSNCLRYDMDDAKYCDQCGLPISDEDNVDSLANTATSSMNGPRVTTTGGGGSKRKKRYDPDNDGDDDSTPEGDTDNDYWSPSGKQLKSLPGKPLGRGASDDSDAESASDHPLFVKIKAKLVAKGMPEDRAEKFAFNAVNLLRKRLGKPALAMANRSGSRQPKDKSATHQMLRSPRHVLRHLASDHKLGVGDIASPLAEHMKFHDAEHTEELAAVHRSDGNQLAHDYAPGKSLPNLPSTKFAPATVGRD